MKTNTTMFSSRTMRCLVTSSLLLHQLLVATAGGGAGEETQTDIKCAGGTCPTPPDANNAPPDCGLWLGPSPIKENEAHGFGLGTFTGRSIPKGSAVDVAELVIPLFDSNLHTHHPPLREYVWDGSNMPDIPLESQHGTFLFIPGLAAIAACTSQNYNAALVGTGAATLPRYNVVEDNAGVSRWSDATAGSFSYRNNVTYTAVRDIVAGEEITVQCEDDDYDGGAYYLSTFSPSDNAVVCVDDNLRVDVSTIAGAGRGVFSKRSISKGSVLTSTPVVPIHEKEMNVVAGNADGADRPQKQLLLNYCYGHPRSDLLLLPYGPLVNYINHVPDTTRPANAVIQWHPTDSSSSNNDKLPRRQQHHHPELLEMSGAKVARVHGKGLMMDIVALRDIAPNEEIFLDYGPEWTEAWRSHVERFQTTKPGEEYMKYVSASDYIRSIDAENAVIRTAREQKHNPYPDNLQTVCFYDAGDDDDEDEEENDEEEDEANDELVVYTSWNTVQDHSCLRPCIILKRYQQDSADDEVLYKAKMLPTDSGVFDACQLDVPHIVTDIPPHAVRIVDRPYTSDMFMAKAFRHEIGVPDGFYPEVWMKKKLRHETAQPNDENNDSFKRRGRTQKAVSV
jgi:hypothetical protein